MIKLKFLFSAIFSFLLICVLLGVSRIPLKIYLLFNVVFVLPAIVVHVRLLRMKTKLDVSQDSIQFEINGKYYCYSLTEINSVVRVGNTVVPGWGGYFAFIPYYYVVFTIENNNYYVSCFEFDKYEKRIKHQKKHVFLCWPTKKEMG